MSIKTGIWFCSYWDEFKVLADGSEYFTNDREDAYDTFKAMTGTDYTREPINFPAHKADEWSN